MTEYNLFDSQLLIVFYQFSEVWDEIFTKKRGFLENIEQLCQRERSGAVDIWCSGFFQNSSCRLSDLADNYD
jgi:hypothetical protein